MDIKMGEIYYADLSRIDKNLQSGIRPVLIVSNNLGNKHSPTVNVLPMSSINKRYLPTHVRIKPSNNNNLPKMSWIYAEQITTINKSYLMRKIGKLDEKDLVRAAKAMILQSPIIMKAMNENMEENYIYKKVTGKLKK